jgi:aminopeptidase N
MKGSCCPHYDEEPERKPSLSKFIENKDIQNCYAIEGGCALHIKNEEVYSAISFRGKKNTFYVDYQSGKTVEKKLPVINI